MPIVLVSSGGHRGAATKRFVGHNLEPLNTDGAEASGVGTQRLKHLFGGGRTHSNGLRRVLEFLFVQLMIAT